MVAVIGLIASIAMASLSILRTKTNEVKRLADINSLQQALEMYALDHDSRYPPESNFMPGRALVGENGTVYMKRIPEPEHLSGSCRETTYRYRLGHQGKTYSMEYCLGLSTNGFKSGQCLAMPGFLCNQSNCSCHDSKKNCCGWCVVGDYCGGGQLAVKNYRLDNGNELKDLVIMPSGCTAEAYEPLCSGPDLGYGLKWSSEIGIDEPADNHFNGLFNTNSLIQDETVDNPIASHCSELIKDKYGDWYLPSYGELSAVYTNKDLGNLRPDYYWSSTEYDNGAFNQVKLFNFDNGTVSTLLKTSNQHYFRCMRQAF